MEQERQEQNENMMDYQEFEKFNNAVGLTVSYCLLCFTWLLTTNKLIENF